MSEVRVRFAPSPTGALHLGGARTALFNYLYARHHDGKFLLRIEDTDRERSTDESTQGILAAMEWLGMAPDEEIIYQSEREPAHRKSLEKLITEKKVYKCYCTPEDRAKVREQRQAEGKSIVYFCDCSDLEDDLDKPFVWRFKMPKDGATVFDDLVQGTISTPNEEIEDIVVARGDGSPLYNFVVVIDDAFQRVSHVVRGKDHLTNTPKQINIYKGLGLPVPQFAHLPLIAGLSKRLRSAGVTSYRDQGYTASGLNNYIARLGWAHGDQELFTSDELIEKFDLKDVGRSEGQLDHKKMEWVNQQHIQTKDIDALIAEFEPFVKAAGVETNGDVDKLKGAVETMRKRAKSLVDLAEGIAFYFVPDGELQVDENAAAKFFTEPAVALLHELADALAGSTDWNNDALVECVAEFIDGKGVALKDIAQPARVAMVGLKKGPGLYETMVVLGKTSTINRLRAASVR